VRFITKGQHPQDSSGRQVCRTDPSVQLEPGPEPLSSHPLHWFIVLTAGTTLCLLGLGGLVTSHGVGMAVPDWPNTYGYNMFFFPISKWVGGIFYEHTHRLLASGVGLLTTILAVWLHGRSARPFLRWTGLGLLALGIITAALAPAHWADSIVLAAVGVAALGSSRFWPRCKPSPNWLRGLGWLAFLMVVLQGVLGGLRVVLFKDQIGVFHATLAQLFFALLCTLALFTSRWWVEVQSPNSAVHNPRSTVHSPTGWKLRWWLAGATVLILCQLVLGATMRHQHAGLAIPDFPRAYGKLWPALDPVSVSHYNQQRLEITAVNPITGAQIVLQMVHRLVAMLIVAAVASCAWRTQRQLGSRHLLTRLARCWLALIFVQVLLGAATIWSNKAADVATAHVVVGALALALGVIGTVVLFRLDAVAQASRRRVVAASRREGFEPSPGVTPEEISGLTPNLNPGRGLT
jgi:heme a synthase